jgi:hypothetical protein
MVHQNDNSSKVAALSVSLILLQKVDIWGTTSHFVLSFEDFTDVTVDNM